MMQRILFLNSRVVAALIVSAFIIFAAMFVSAQGDAIVYPIPELGDCGSKSECHAYCDDLSHVDECVAFAQAHGLMSVQEADDARKFMSIGGKGPGDCTSKEECETYCEDPTNMRQCIAFAKETGLMEGDELKEAEKVLAYIDAGGVMPGGCRGEQACKAYCEDEVHMNECIDFATKAGFMSEEEVEIFKKTGGTGPGGCKGRACEKFCQDEVNREVCITFAMEHGLMSPEDKVRMEEGIQKAREALEKAPPEVLTCIEQAIGSAEVERIRSGQGFTGAKIGEVLPQCFREVMGGGENRGPFGPDSAATDCMRKIFGDDFEEQMQNGTLDPGARDQEIRECMQESMGEGFLNEAGQWERPQSGGPSQGNDMPPEQQDREWQNEDTRQMFPEPYRADHQSGDVNYYNSTRAEMEAKMRAEMEAQMQSGNFDRNKLPPDFNPEGVFLPPEAYNRPPEGYDGAYMPPPEGFMPEPGTTIILEGIPPSGGYTMPPPSSNESPSTQSNEPVSSIPGQLLANIIGIFQKLFGVR